MESNFNISNLTSFKIGGSIKKVYFPSSIGEFVEILKSEKNAKVFGNLSNTLISSYGYDGTVVLTTKMTNIEIDGTTVKADCGVKGPKLAQLLQEKGLSGFEFMIGFPGTIGGNLYMNASANNQCISENLISVDVYYKNQIVTISKDELDFSYRHSSFMDDNRIILSAEFDLKNDTPEIIKQRMQDNLKFRTNHQPSLALPNCGSVFKNPAGDSAGRLLDSVGAKNMAFGGAYVWDKHANFIINKNATSTDVLKLMDNMATAVENFYGIKLLPEMRFLGNNKEEVELCKKLKIE